MKKYFSYFYWPLMVVVMACILASIMGSLANGLFLSLALMPGVLFVKYFSKDLSFKDRCRGILNLVYFILIVLLIEYLCIILAYVNLYGHELPKNMPGIMRNPLFVLFLVGAVIAIEKLIAPKLPPGSDPAERFVTFTSERSRISLAVSNILYIESRDYEVLVVTVQGSAHPTRMKISQWEAVLDGRFVRIHRAFIVNRDYVAGFDSKTVRMITGQSFEISRKYHDTAPDKLARG